MPFLRIDKSWDFQVKELHNVRLDVREGFFNDMMRLYIDGYLVVTAKAGLVGARGSETFEIDGRLFQMRWIWNMWTGNPASIVIVYNERIFAQIGTDRAAWD